MSYEDNELERCKQETISHKSDVACNILKLCQDLKSRAINHDDSKLQQPEIGILARVTGTLKGLTYGSPEYMAQLESLKPFSQHHYEANRHHPEHFSGGVDDMTLVDLLEMISDWTSATKKHSDGNIFKSIEHNTKRFNLSPQLAKILKNTVVEYFPESIPGN